jgi:UDP-glucose 4-epimerase
MDGLDTRHPRLLITGSRGFIGGSVGRFAATLGWSVVGLSRSAQPDSDWPGDHLCIDVSTDAIEQILRSARPDVIIHAAGPASVRDSFREPLADLRAAILGWGNVLDAVRRSESQPLVVYLSSAAIYGQPESLPIAENAPQKPLSPYGYHKVLGEQMAAEYVSCFGLKCLVARVFSVIGPRQRRLLVWELVRQALQTDGSVNVRGTGAETRDYLYVDDLARALLALARNTGALNELEIVNVASGVETRVSELAELIASMASTPRAVKYQGLKSVADPQRWVADTSRLTQLLGPWHPRGSKESVLACLDAWRQDLQFTAVRSER